MKAYHNSAVLRNDGPDASTGKVDLNAGVGVQVTIRINSTQALASIFDLNGVATANPLTTNNNGNYAFKAADNIYDIIISEGTANEEKIEKIEVIEAVSPIRVIPFESLSLAVAETDPVKMFGGASIYITSRAGSKGSISCNVISGTGTANGKDIIAHDTLNLSLVINLGAIIDTSALSSNGGTDIGVQAAVDTIPFAQEVTISTTPTYTENVKWKGKEHKTSQLPFLLNSVEITGGNLNARMLVDNGVLYSCGYSANRIEMFSLSDPRNPRQFAEIATSSQPRHVAVFGKYVIVCCHGASKIEFYDTDAVASGNLIGTITTGTNPKMFELDGNTLYVPCAGINKIQKYTFVLPSGDIPFSYTLKAEASTGSTPLCCSLNGAGLLAVTGLGDLVNLYGTKNLNNISNSTIGGAGHGICVWKNKTQLLVGDSTQNKVHSVDFTNISLPSISDSIEVVSNPEQITIVGDRFYVPQLETVGGLSKLSAVDIVDVQDMFEYKQVDLSVKDAGFTAYYDAGGNTGYLYVNGHATPFNIDVVEIVKGDFKSNQRNIQSSAYAPKVAFDDAEISNLKATITTVNQNYRTVLSAGGTATVSDNIIRSGQGGAVVLPDPATMDKKQLTIVNVDGSSTANVTNAFTGFSGTLASAASVTVVSMSFGGTWQWDAISSHGTIT